MAEATNPEAEQNGSENNDADDSETRGAGGRINQWAFDRDNYGGRTLAEAREDDGILERWENPHGDEMFTLLAPEEAEHKYYAVLSGDCPKGNLRANAYAATRHDIGQEAVKWMRQYDYEALGYDARTPEAVKTAEEQRESAIALIKERWDDRDGPNFMSKPDLKDLAEEYDVKKGGTKAELMDRLAPAVYDAGVEKRDSDE